MGPCSPDLVWTVSRSWSSFNLSWSPRGKSKPFHSNKTKTNRDKWSRKSCKVSSRGTSYTSAPLSRDTRIKASQTTLRLPQPSRSCWMRLIQAINSIGWLARLASVRSLSRNWNSARLIKCEAVSSDPSSSDILLLSKINLIINRISRMIIMLAFRRLRLARRCHRWWKGYKGKLDRWLPQEEIISMSRWWVKAVGQFSQLAAPNHS